MKMLGRIGWSPSTMSGQHRCGECDIGWPRGSRKQKRIEEREWQEEELGQTSDLPKPYK